VLGTGVENVLILGGPYPVRNIFIIMQVSNDNGLTTDGAWGLNVTLVCVRYGDTLAVDVRRFFRNVWGCGRLCIDQKRLRLKGGFT
jgi:hypothetical protein